jgi:endonuclease YncB( thermonuclease family)
MRRRRTLSTLPLLALLAWGAGCTHAVPASADFTGKVVAVSDGDTITVLRDRTQVKVRLHGIDCPETGQDFGSRAQQDTSRLAFGQVVTVRPRDTDRYGRTVAEVVLPDGRSRNQELVRGGLAWWYRAYAPDDGTLARLEAEAKAAGRGLWAQPAPVPPWEWRARGKTPIPAEMAGRFIGNCRSHVFHAPGCRNAANISPSNRVAFGSAAEAEAAGYRPGKDCHPKSHP